MRTAAQAREDAIAWLAASGFGSATPTIMDDMTEEFPAGWIYRYQSAAFLRTGGFEHSLLGNAPLFIPRNGAEPQFISSHRPTLESAEAFSCCGDANAQPNAEIELKGWTKDARKVSATQAIRAHSSLGLAAAHDVVHRCLSGQETLIKTADVASARALASRLLALGFLACMTYSVRRQAASAAGDPAPPGPTRPPAASGEMTCRPPRTDS